MTTLRTGVALVAGVFFGCAKTVDGQEAAMLPPPPNMTDAPEGPVPSEPEVRAAPVPAAVEGATLEQALEAEAAKGARRSR